jgi:hypothetical protein
MPQTKEKENGGITMVKWDDVKKEIKSISETEKSAIEILAKYEDFYKGGSGYTFQVEVYDFNVLVQYIAELHKEIEEHCETKGLAGRKVFALTKRVDELTERINKVTAECGVTWINETLLGKEPKRTELIRQLGEKACDRNDKALKKMEQPQKGIRIEGNVFADNGDIDQTEFADAFVDFVESKGWEFGGSLKVKEDKMEE